MRSLLVVALVSGAAALTATKLPLLPVLTTRTPPPKPSSVVLPDDDLSREDPKTAALFALNAVVIAGVKGGIDLLYRDRDVERFYVLETVARVPYFAFASVLHLRETFGDRDGCDLLKLHYAQSDNELAHLLIMESLGGNSSAVDRAVASAAAVGFFWYATALYAFNPRVAYHLSELIETHAFATYDAFLKRNERDLRSRPVPAVARDYYCSKTPFLFDLSSRRVRRPRLTSLYDVFLNVRDDEHAHRNTLHSLVGHLPHRGRDEL